MQLTLFSQNRSVLFISDEGLYIYATSQSAVSLIEYIPWDTLDFEDVVADLLKKDCGAKPVLLVNDMTDQHFKGGQRLPKVGPLDKKSVLKRKLEVSFPNYPIRGALPIKGEKRDPKGTMYLFAAIPMSEAISKTLKAVSMSMVSISGFCLLPIESTDMVAQFSKKLTGATEEKSRWAVFMGQHKCGSLRQVIVRDGQLAMTRMTPVSDAATGPEQWAAEVIQEFKATISYLSRFGYSPEEKTDLIIIGDKEATDILESKINLESGRFTSFTAPEAASVLGLKIGLQDETRYADALHAAWIGKKTRFILPMDAKELTAINQPRQYAAAASVLLVLSAGFLGWQVATNAQGLIQIRQDISDQTFILSNAEKAYQEQVERMKALGFDVNLIQGSVSAYKDFETKQLNSLALIKTVSEALGDELRLDEFILNTSRVIRPVQGYQAYGAKPKKDTQVDAVLKLSFPTTVEPEDSIREVNGLTQRLKRALPEYTVDISRQVARPEYTQNVSGVAKENENIISSKDDYTAEIVLTRMITDEKVQKP